jgi:hypothetical protein
MVEYQRQINELMMSRMDLSEETIVKEVQTIASKNPCTVKDVLQECKFLAAKGVLLPWEKLEGEK